MSNWMQGEAQQEMAAYFCDFAPQPDGDRPESMASRVPHRPSCRGRIGRLKEAVLGRQGGAKKARSSMNRNVIDLLDEHFHYLDEPVVCSRVRVFLAGLLDPALEVRIPTPITVHLDHCPRCTDEFQSLRRLALGREQLQRLQKLYEHGPADGLLLCRRARSSIAAFVRGSLKGIDSEILSHLSTCPRCRADVYARRQVVLSELAETPDDCHDHVTAAGLFDYVVPDADAAHDAEMPGASHVSTCRECLETIQAIHRVIYGIAERPESGVATVYRVVEADESLAIRADDPYAMYGVSVEAVRREPDRSPARSRTALKGATFNPHVRRILKTAVAAAAIIPLAALFLYTHSSSGTAIGKAMRAFGRARNIRVIAYSPIAEKVTQELWVARELNLHCVMTAGTCVVYDAARKKKVDIESGRVNPVDDHEIAGVKRMADSCVEFTLADVPPDAKWDRVDGDGDRDVYEFAWIRETYGGRGIPTRCEVGIDKSTTLPEYLRVFRMDSPEAGWECKSLIRLEYPTEAEMRSALAGEFQFDANGGR